eukprot:CAMPEP_0202444912 /NCGR_PEP_ID=MMETSP1360-20130828/3828_1 /ASSEMBLY_ACC=CAM_ASM_000848 /TAXON_ID=515479 /ORGANISM="Licmophora paradoxa, Strain CCMP2313" /LENGTH=408 /DNA_ID=CAMNT_0049061011 /DNA_START=308 /DNA_END=1534 /DNA_ORIENTATION=-
MATASQLAANPFAAKSKNNAKSAYVKKLMRGAKTTSGSQLRRLDQEVQVDVSGYSVKFEKCQFIKSYSDEYAQNEEAETVLGTDRFVIFRLCPNNSCEYCSTGFGEYMVDLESYLEATVQYQQELQENYCKACEECQNADDEAEADEGDENNNDERRRKLADVDCSTCYDECQKIENMEENGYIDATMYLECQQIYDPEDDSAQALYAGPMCASSGSKINIGVFQDEECNQLLSGKNVEKYLVDDDGNQMKLSHALLKTTYGSSNCVSCLKVDENENDNDGDNDQQPEANEMCEQLYEAAAKCEDVHGFDNGYSGYNYQGNNQAAQEELVCDFISSIYSGSYDDEGEITVYGANSAMGGGSTTTGGQKFALTFFILGTVGLIAYAGILHGKLTGGSKSQLSSQGGAMA